MKKFLFLLLFSLCFSISVKAQDAEKDAVRRVVETYLFSEEAAERSKTISGQAEIFSVNAANGQIAGKPFRKAKKNTNKIIVAVQKIVSIDVFRNAAIVKVETDLSLRDIKIPKHYHFISLLKEGGEWKIVSLLMPDAAPN
ncbi:MAG: nuclear transport factor 2 family protein [Pyrinomonadaceae bacterium]